MGLNLGGRGVKKKTYRQTAFNTRKRKLSKKTREKYGQDVFAACFFSWWDWEIMGCVMVFYLSKRFHFRWELRFATDMK